MPKSWGSPALDSKAQRLPARRGFPFAAGLLITAMIALGPAPSRGEQGCPRGGSESGTIVAVDERDDLTLEDGTRLKIAGIDPARPTPASPEIDVVGRDRLAHWVNGLRIEFARIGPGRDRWGRIAALVFALPPELSGARDQTLLGVGQALLDAGLARVDPNSLPGPCRDSFLAAEAGARASGLGLWADPYFVVISAGSREALAEKSGSSVIAEGRVTGLSFRKPRITLYLGQQSGPDFSATIMPHGSKEFEAAQSRLANLTGQTIRVRGLLDTRFGNQIEISSLEALEVLVQAEGAAAFGSFK